MGKKLLAIGQCILLLICMSIGTVGCSAQKKIAPEKKVAVKKVPMRRNIATPSSFKAASIPQTINNIKDVSSTIAQILKGKDRVEGKVCQVSSDRKDINVTILGKKTESIGHEFSFEMVDNSKALCLAELALQEKEIDFVEKSLMQKGILITAIHNHWLMDKPQIIYMHSQGIMNPVEFATKVIDVLNKL